MTIVEEGLLHKLPHMPRRVAIFRPGRMGDFVCATPALRALRLAMPEAEITYIALAYSEELVERSDSLDRFALFPAFPVSPSSSLRRGDAPAFLNGCSERNSISRFSSTARHLQQPVYAPARRRPDRRIRSGGRRRRPA